MSDHHRPHRARRPSAAEPAAADTARRRIDLGRFRELSLIPAIGVLMLIGFIVSPAFLTADNLIGVLQQSTELSLLVLATALILICGRMDLSLESTIGVAPVIAVWLVLPSQRRPVHGSRAVPRMDGGPALPPGRRGDRRLQRIPHPQAAPQRVHRHPRRPDHAARTPGGPLRRAVHRGLPPSFAYLGKTAWLGVPAAIWICAVLFAVGGSALAWLRHGRALYAIGGNAEAARTAGIRVDRIVWVVLVIGGLLAAFAGILYSGHYGSISATQGSGWIFQVFAATVIGGVSLNGGKGSVFGALTGVLTLQLVVNVMTLAGVPPLWNQFLNGAIIIVALIISRFASGEKQE